MAEPIETVTIPVSMLRDMLLCMWFDADECKRQGEGRIAVRHQRVATQMLAAIDYDTKNTLKMPTAVGIVGRDPLDNMPLIGTVMASARSMPAYEPLTEQQQEVARPANEERFEPDQDHSARMTGSGYRPGQGHP